MIDEKDYLIKVFVYDRIIPINKFKSIVKKSILLELKGKRIKMIKHKDYLKDKAIYNNMRLLDLYRSIRRNMVFIEFGKKCKNDKKRQLSIEKEYGEKESTQLLQLLKLIRKDAITVKFKGMKNKNDKK